MSAKCLAITTSVFLAGSLLLPVAMLLSSTVHAATTQDTTTQFLFVDGRLSKYVSPRGVETLNQYDALNRITQQTESRAVIVKYEYDGLDQLTQVTDARGVITAYSIDGLGNLLQSTSGDSGTTINTYDDAGNLITRTDAKQQKTTFRYDVLNRVVLVTFHDNTTAAYEYDQGSNATGKLSKVTDPSGVVQYGYDLFGRLITDSRTIGGSTYATVYRYDNAGRLSGMRYPSGRDVSYSFDALGRISQVDTSVGSSLTPLVTQVSYQPFGPAHSITFGNGRTQVRTYDLDGRMSSYTLAAQTMALGYNPSSDITSIADAANAANTTTYGYDLKDRLTSVSTSGSAQNYKYDGVGNRTEKVNNSAVTVYTYGTTHNRLVQVGAQAITTDANGSNTDKVGATFNYDARGRMVAANTAIGLLTYTINSLGQRVRKVTPTDTTVFHYDVGGKLIAESTTTGATTKTQEYVYLGDMPVAVLK